MFLVCVIFVLIGLYADKEWDPMQAVNELPVTFGLLLIFVVVGSAAVNKFLDPILNMVPGIEKSPIPSDSKW